MLHGSLRGGVRGLRLLEQLQDLLEPLLVGFPLVLHLGALRRQQAATSVSRSGNGDTRPQLGGQRAARLPRPRPTSSPTRAARPRAPPPTALPFPSPPLSGWPGRATHRPAAPSLSPGWLPPTSRCAEPTESPTKICNLVRRTRPPRVPLGPSAFAPTRVFLVSQPGQASSQPGEREAASEHRRLREPSFNFCRNIPARRRLAPKTQAAVASSPSSSHFFFGWVVSTARVGQSCFPAPNMGTRLPPCARETRYCA